MDAGAGDSNAVPRPRRWYNKRGHLNTNIVSDLIRNPQGKVGNISAGSVKLESVRASVALGHNSSDSV